MAKFTTNSSETLHSSLLQVKRGRGRTKKIQTVVNPTQYPQRNFHVGSSSSLNM